MTISTQLHVIRLLALGMLLILPATSGAQRPPILEKLTKTYVSNRLGRSKRSAIPSTQRPPDSISPDHGPGNPRPTRSPMKGKTSRAIR